MAGFDTGLQANIDRCPYLSPWCRESLGWTVFGRVHMDELWEFLSQDDDRPFFVWFAPMLPHSPMDAPAEYPCLYLPKFFQRLLECDAGIEPVSPALHANAVHYYANITRFDDVLAELTGFLDDHGIRENTLLIYVSDNGYQQDPYTGHGTGPWVGGPKGKLTIYELGFRTPVIFNWPGYVPAGRVLDDLVSFEDVYSTVLGYAGVAAPADREGGDLRPRIDGRAEPLRDRLIGKVTQHQLPEAEIPPPFVGPAHRDEDAFFLRTEDWRYVQFADRGYEELYEIRVDPFEDADLAATYPELVAGFREEVSAWKTHLAGCKGIMEVAGKLSTGDGTPIPLARVSLAGRNEAGRTVSLVVHTAGDGSFVFPDVAAGKYTLTVRGAGTVSYEGRVVSAIPLDLSRSATGPYLPLQGELSKYHGPVETTSEILGRVTTANGVPVGGLAVEILHDGLFWRGRTNADGRFQATALPSGSFGIHFELSKGCPRVEDVRVYLRGDETRHVNVTARGRDRCPMPTRAEPVRAGPG